MYRDILISIAGHAVALFGLVVPSFIHMQEAPQPMVYTVRTVTPQAVEQLREPPAPVEEPEPDIPEVAVEEPDEVLPRETNKPKQTVKQEEPRPQQQQEKPEEEPAEEGESTGETQFQGIRLESEFDHPEYLMEMRDRIQRNWHPPTLNQPLSTRVYFRIARDGSIVRIYVEQNTGRMQFDSSAVNAVIMSAPFPPLPDDFKEEYLGVHFDFIYDF